MMQDAEPIGLEEEISVSKDTVIPDERPSRPADCIRSPRSTSVFGFKVKCSQEDFRQDEQDLQDGTY